MRSPGGRDRHYGWHRPARPFFAAGEHRRRIADHRAPQPPPRGVPPWIGLPVMALAATLAGAGWVNSLRPTGRVPAPLPGIIEQPEPRTSRKPAGESPPRQPTARQTEPPRTPGPTSDPEPVGPGPTLPPDTPSRDDTGTQPPAGPAETPGMAASSPCPPPLPQDRHPTGKPGKPKTSRGPPVRPGRENEDAPLS